MNIGDKVRLVKPLPDELNCMVEAGKIPSGLPTPDQIYCVREVIPFEPGYALRLVGLTGFRNPLNGYEYGYEAECFEVVRPA